MRLNVISKFVPGRSLGLAVALACGTAIVAAGVAEPAHAQKKDRKKKDKEQAAYSKEFIEAYKPLEEAVNVEGTDLGGLSGQLAAMAALANSPDEKLAGGNLIYSVGARSGDRTLQLEGMEMMLGSGKIGTENVGQYNFVAYQLANALEQHEKARGYLQIAIDANYTSDQVSPELLQAEMAESYFRQNRFIEGLDYLSNAIAASEATGSAAPESWYRRGLQIGYTNDIQPQVYDFVIGWVANYPSEANWTDAINIARNLNTFNPAETLDLMRLAFRMDNMPRKQDYIEYVEAADPRRLPKEVADVIEQGYSSGRVSKDDIYLADSLSTAKARIAADRSDLPSLESDARAADAGLRTVVAAGDTFLSYGQLAKAEEFYTKALGMAGVNTAEVQMRLGIAQAKQGKADAATANFAQVEGSRKAIAGLWTAYLQQSSAAASAATAPSEEATPGG